jgi:hypothetical protein
MTGKNVVAATCNCKDIKPMKDWATSPSKNKKMCHSCMIGVPANWYEAELRDNGRGDLADELESHRVSETATAESVAKKMDDIKDRVDQPLKERLLELDCTTQCADS